jgi:nuclear pore complex protein Nup62
LSFGSFGAKPADASSSSSAPAAPAGGLFGTKPTTTPAVTGAATPAATISMAGSGAATPATKAPTPTAGATAAPSEPAPNLLRGKTLEDIVDTWSKDLDSQVKEFERQAGEVREWDKVLVRNGTQIATLHRRVLEAQSDQAALDRNLDYIQSQQQTLDQMLSHYEREMSVWADKDTKPLAAKIPADREREKAYALAEDLNKQLDDVSRNLSQMIDEVNKLSTSGAAPAVVATPPSAADAQVSDDPINQLSAILGAHLRAIHSIDSNTSKLAGKVGELEARSGQKGAYSARR